MSVTDYRTQAERDLAERFKRETATHQMTAPAQSGGGE